MNSNSKALIEAAAAGDLEEIRRLVAAGANINYRSGTHCQSPLHLALMNRHVTCVDFLIENGADINEDDVNQAKPLHVAALRGDHYCVTRLLDAGADIHSLDHKGFTALHYAAGDDYPDCVQLLLDRGADIDRGNFDGVTPLHDATYYGCTKSIQALLKNNADVLAKNHTNETALDIAEENDHADIMGLLKAAMEKCVLKKHLLENIGGEPSPNAGGLLNF